MINIEEEIIKKFPKIKEKNSLLCKSILSIAKKIVHEEHIND